jgi:hypothetical protein
MSNPDWNPRFVLYAKSRGLSPDDALAQDAKDYPGGRMTGFLVWSNDKTSAYRKAHGLKTSDPILDQDHYDAWLGVSTEGA